MSPLARWLPVVAYMAAIFAMSSVSNPPELPSGSDKNVHALVYAGLSGLVVRALAHARLPRVNWQVAAAAVVICAVYGVSDELHQAFVPGRQSDRWDVVADAAGAAAAAVAIRVWATVRTARSH